ncbi:MAG: 3-dehydroquinate synthase [Parvularculaceae bacterium]|nr:3-dehydroquinate synthase [Parvularculaceae bacterium]
MKAETVRVALGDRSYDILIGDDLIDNAAFHLAPLLKRPFTVVVTDAAVEALHGKRLRAAVAAGGIRCETIVLPGGEATKSFAQLESLCETLLGLGVERGDLVIAFGGGVIGDLTGFAASVLRRGCRFAQIPTTLLAQVDSSVGGKTAINARHGKNLIGAFHQPAIVLADIGVLDTLPARQVRAGYAEIVKYGALGDAGFFQWLEGNGARVISGDTAARREAVMRSCRAKAAIVAADEREEGARALLNLGHTFGHALEAAFGFSERLLHGEAVAAGMGLAFDFSVSEHHCAAAAADRIKAHLRASGLPAGVSDIDGVRAHAPASLLDLMLQDKKVEAGALTLILTRRIGEAFVARGVATDKVLRFLTAQSR